MKLEINTSSTPRHCNTGRTQCLLPITTRENTPHCSEKSQ